MEKVAFVSLISLSGVYGRKRIDQIRVNGLLVVEEQQLSALPTQKDFSLKK